MLVAILLVLGLGLFLRPKSPPTLDLQTVSRTNLVQSVSVSGAVAAKKIANLSFITSGLLTFIGAQEGDMVKAGQIVATIDQRTVEKNIQNAVDAYEIQKVSYNNVNDFNGDRALSDTGLSIAARRQLETAADSLDQAKVALDIQQIAQQQSVITSPIDGILTRLDAKTVGMNVTPTMVFMVVDPKSLVFDMDVDEADIGKVTLNQLVKINLDPYPDSTLSFQVSNIDFVSHTTTNGGNAFTVEVKLPTDNVGKYRVGMNGNAEIITGEHDHVLTVPQASLVNNDSVFVKVARGYEKKRVTLGLQNDVDVEVTKGLQEGDKVVLQPDKVPQNQVVQG